MDISCLQTLDCSHHICFYLIPGKRVFTAIPDVIETRDTTGTDGIYRGDLGYIIPSLARFTIDVFGGNPSIRASISIIEGIAKLPKNISLNST